MERSGSARGDREGRFPALQQVMHMINRLPGRSMRPRLSYGNYSEESNLMLHQDPKSYTVVTIWSDGTIRTFGPYTFSKAGRVKRQLRNYQQIKFPNLVVDISIHKLISNESAFEYRSANA